MDTPENREVPIRVNFGAGLHAAAEQRVDAARTMSTSVVGLGFSCRQCWPQLRWPVETKCWMSPRGQAKLRWPHWLS